MEDKGNATVLLAVAALAVSVLAIVIGQINRSEDQQRQQRDAQADLRFVDNSFRIANGYTILTFENRSSRSAAAISQISFEISDPVILGQIEAKTPKPQGPLAMSSNGSDDAIFRDGSWSGENSYEFNCVGGFNIKAGEVGDVRLKIANRKWAGREFVGNLAIYYNGPLSPYKLRRVTIQASSDLPQQPKTLKDRRRLRP